MVFKLIIIYVLMIATPDRWGITYFNIARVITSFDSYIKSVSTTVKVKIWDIMNTIFYMIVSPSDMIFSSANFQTSCTNGSLGVCTLKDISVLTKTTIQDTTPTIKALISLSTILCFVSLFLTFGIQVFKLLIFNRNSRNTTFVTVSSLFKRIGIALLSSTIIPLLSLNLFVISTTVGVSAGSYLYNNAGFKNSNDNMSSFAFLQGYARDKKQFGISGNTYCVDEEAENPDNWKDALGFSFSYKLAGNYNNDNPSHIIKPYNAIQGIVVSDSYDGLIPEDSRSFPKVIYKNESGDNKTGYDTNHKEVDNLADKSNVPGGKTLWETYCSTKLTRSERENLTGEVNKKNKGTEYKWDNLYPAKVAQTVIDKTTDEFLFDYPFGFPDFITFLRILIIGWSFIFFMYITISRLADIISSNLVLWYYVKEMIDARATNAIGMFINKILVQCISQFITLALLGFLVAFVGSEGFWTKPYYIILAFFLLMIAINSTSNVSGDIQAASNGGALQSTMQSVRQNLSSQGKKGG